MVLIAPNPLCREYYTEKCVMNNYFGIGLDAKISLDFNNKRDEHPEKCRWVAPVRHLSSASPSFLLRRARHLLESGRRARAALRQTETSLSASCRKAEAPLQMWGQRAEAREASLEEGSPSVGQFGAKSVCENKRLGDGRVSGVAAGLGWHCGGRGREARCSRGSLQRRRRASLCAQHSSCVPSGVRAHGGPAPQEGVHAGPCPLSLGCAASSPQLPSLLPLACAQEGRNEAPSSWLR